MDLIVVSSSMTDTEEEGFVDTRTASEVMREVDGLKREVAGLRGAVDVLRWEASLRGVLASIDASFAKLHDKLDK